MVSPEITAYLKTLAAYNERLKAWNTRHRATPGIPVSGSARKDLDELNALHDELIILLERCLPDGVIGRNGLPYEDFDYFEANYVWLPLLTEEFGGDKDLAYAAWALGQRPIGFPSDSQNG